MKKIYISGRISGLPIEVARGRFAAAEAYLRERYPDAEIYNPTKFCRYEPGKPWQDYMHLCLSVLEQCDFLVLLPNWLESNGAQCEYYYARGLHLAIYHYAQIKNGTPDPAQQLLTPNS